MNNFNNIEFHTSPEGEILIKTGNDPMRELTEKDIDLINYMFDRVRNEYTTAYNKLQVIYSKHERNILFFKYVCVRRFLRCNFSNYDTLTNDIGCDGIFHFEQVGCPMRGECEGYKIICQPKYNSNLSDRELEIFDLYCRPMEIDEVANYICLSPHTIDQHLKNIRRKLNAHSKAELMKIHSERMRK